MLNSAGMSNRDLGRERPRIELNSHPGLPCGGGYKDITQSPGKVLWLGQNLGAGMGGGEPCVLIYLFIMGTLVGTGVYPLGWDCPNLRPGEAVTQRS